MKKLFVCGDSWMSPTIKYPKTHFSEKFAEKIGYELISYAHSGMSNGGIAIQIDTAIQQKADLILFNSTGFDRIEFFKDSDLKKPEPLNLSNLNVSDLLYYDSCALSTVQKRKNDNTTLISDSLNTLISIFDNKMKTELTELAPDLERKLKIIKQYVLELYHPSWKLQLDRMTMYAIANKLHFSGIPYIYCFDPIGAICTGSNHSNHFKWSWVEPKNYICIDRVNTLIEKSEMTGFDPGYHTSFETQIGLSDILFAHYNKYF